MIVDVEASKAKYLSRWHHCSGKDVVATGEQLHCLGCKDTFPWSEELGETVRLALAFTWLQEKEMEEW